eukprot:4920097-Prymnesium_polylepis.1
MAASRSGTTDTASMETKLVVSGVPTTARVMAPAEVFVGAWLNARLLLSVATSDAEEQPEWRMLLGAIGCRASLLTAEGAALLPIAAQQERHVEPYGVRACTEVSRTPLQRR